MTIVTEKRYKSHICAICEPFCQKYSKVSPKKLPKAQFDQRADPSHLCFYLNAPILFIL